METKISLPKIRAALEEQRQKLLSRLKVEAELTNRVNNPDRSDLAWRYIQSQRDILLSERAEQHLAEIEAALDRINNGSYGKCEKCGQEIHPLRLETMPTTTYCMKCKVENQ